MKRESIIDNNSSPKQRKFFYGNKLIQIFFFVKKLDFYVVFVVEAEHVAAGCLVVLQTADRRQHWARALVLQPNPLGIYIQYGGPAQGSSTRTRTKPTWFLYSRWRTIIATRFQLRKTSSEVVNGIITRNLRDSENVRKENLHTMILFNPLKHGKFCLEFINEILCFLHGNFESD